LSRRAQAIERSANRSDQRAVLFMEQHLLDPVTLSQLADRGLTIFQLNTAFRREVGAAVSVPVAAADQRCDGIAAQGHADRNGGRRGWFLRPAAHVHRHFRRRFGLTPGQLVAGDMCDARTVESGTGRRSAAVPADPESQQALDESSAR
jgi:AraC-like DNA-binding protein